VENYVTLQKVCRVSRNEKEIRSTPGKIWNQPEKAKELIAAIADKNKDLYEFEESLKV
jgi:hypothetical protein